MPSTLSDWKTPIITFSVHSKPHPRSTHSISCDAFVFDTQGQLPYIPPTKKEVLINFNDIIRTVNIVDTLTNIAILRLIILIRSFLSLILHLEIGDRWQ